MNINLKPAIKFRLAAPQNFVHIVTGGRHNEIYDYLVQTKFHICEVEEGFLYEDALFVNRFAATRILQQKKYLPKWYQSPLTSEILDFLLGEGEYSNPLLKKIKERYNDCLSTNF